MSNFIDELSLLVLTCVLEPLDPFADRVKECLATASRSEWILEKGPLDIKKVYFPRPQRGGAEPMRVVIWSPLSQPDISAFYPNSSDGWSTLIQCLSDEGMPDSISIRSTRDGEKWSLQNIHYMSSGGQTKRLLQLIKEEDGFKFYQEGSPFDFENLTIKPRRRISTREDVLEFIGHLGIDLRDGKFWVTDRDAIYLYEQRVNPSSDDDL
jgi:hypothetical protein